MSAITEYLKLIPLALRNSSGVVEGIVNSVKMQHGYLPEEEQAEIIRRRGICETCPFMSENAKKDPAQHYTSERVDKHCSICFCNIDLKTSSLESNCGLEIHNQRNSDNQIELKWTKYK